MTPPSSPRALACLVLLAASLGAVPLAGAAPGDPPAKKAGMAGGSLLPGASSKDPVSIDAGKLDYFDKEQKLVYTGEVVARQGESTLHASTLTIFLARGADKAGSTDSVATGPQTSGNSVRRMEAAGPVTIVQKDQVGTGDSGTYDKAENKITLVGNVTLSQATNIVKGDKLVYDMTSGQAQVSSGQTQKRVLSVFTPGSGTAATPGAAKKPKHGGTAVP